MGDGAGPKRAFYELRSNWKIFCARPPSRCVITLLCTRIIHSLRAIITTIHYTHKRGVYGAGGLHLFIILCAGVHAAIKNGEDKDEK